MPSAVTAFSVKIASPGDTAIEGVIAREVIAKWNSDHCWDEKKVLVPVCGSEAESNDKNCCDLLVAFFCTSLGAPSDETARDADVDIDRQVKAGRPVLVYFSQGRVDFAGANAEEVRSLEQFKKKYPAEASVDCFSDEKEFRAKFAQQLDATISRHAHFQTAGHAAAVTPTVVAEAHPPAPVYSKEAQVLLMNACDDPEAYLARTDDSRGLKIQVNGRQFVEVGNAESAATWKAAFDELIAHGLIRDAGYNLFQVSAKGFEFLETLGKYPIGYIAELGSV
jgi:hypothetical protein